MEYAASGADAPALTYAEAVDYLTGLGRFGVKLGLDRTRAILDELDHPERGLRGALVAGTNGKGSTTAFLESILRAAGLSTGMTPSPHLRSYTERIELNGRPLSEADFAAAVTSLRPRLAAVTGRMGEPTEFEILIALALSWLGPRADRLVIEVGMGGRLDSTNVLDLGVAVITNVGLDHTEHLGSSLAQIAAEKAAIIKPGNVVVTGASGEALRVVEEAAQRGGASALWRLGKELELRQRWLGWDGTEIDVGGPGFEHRSLRVPLLGEHQAWNAALAVAAAHALGDATHEAVRAGVASTRWPGRLELIAEKTLFDGAHNPEGLRQMVRAVHRLLDGSPVCLVFAAMADKDGAAMLAELRPLEPAHAVFTRAASAGRRAMKPEHLAALWAGPHEVCQDAHEALVLARSLAGPRGWVLVCGTLYLAGELAV